MDDVEDKQALAVRAKNEVVLSVPGKLLTRLTVDVLPLALHRWSTDEEKAKPRFKNARRLFENDQLEEALKEFLVAAEYGHRQAQYDAGNMYLDGIGTKKNFERAYYWFHRAADQGDADSLNKLGWMCEAGLGVPRDHAKAVNWFRQAAERGHLEAQFNLAAKYDNGEGVVQNHAEAVRWYRLAAEQGLADARFFLAQALEVGEGVPKDIEEALDWFILAAEQDHQSAKRRLWALAVTGVYTPEDDLESIFIEKLGVEMNSALAEFKQGYRYLFGEGVNENSEEAIDLLTKSANKGFLPATAYLSLAYSHGIGTARSKSLAGQWKAKSARAKVGALEPDWMYFDGVQSTAEEVTQFRTNRLLASAGNASAIADLATAYYFGRGTKVDRLKSYYWCSRAAEKNDGYCQYLLGYMLLHDDCVVHDEKRAITYLKKAAALGISAAGFLAAETILDGSPDSRRTNTARKLLIEAAEQGNANAQFSLGYRYTNGKGLPRSDEMAIIWYKKAVSQGVSAASFNLAIKYENAFGVERNLDEALRLYKDAATRGLVSGCKKLARIFSGAESVFGLRDEVQEKYWNDEAVRLEKLESQSQKGLTTSGLLESSRTSRSNRLAAKRLMERKVSISLTNE